MVAILSGLLTGACSVVGVRTAPEPGYTVERTVGTVQIRRYGSRVAAETVVAADEIRARTIGFERLAGYIFGGNDGRVRIEMTAPVAQSVVGQSAAGLATPGRLPGAGSAPAAPVDQAARPDGTWRIRFFMPANETLSRLPRPADKDVVLVAVPPETVAVLRYAGSPTRDAVRDADQRLLRQLGTAGIAVEGAPFGWFYDPPWTIPALRRNEAVVRVAG